MKIVLVGILFLMQAKYLRFLSLMLLRFSTSSFLLAISLLLAKVPQMVRQKNNEPTDRFILSEMLEVSEIQGFLNGAGKRRKMHCLVIKRGHRVLSLITW